MSSPTTLAVVPDTLWGNRKLLSLREAERSLATGLLKCLPRQALHASALELTHPVTGARASFASTLPEDFERALGLLREHRARDSG